MPDIDPSLEYLMREYLDEQKRLAGRGITLETVFFSLEDSSRRIYGVQQALETVVRDQIAHGMRLDRYGKEIRHLKKRLGEDKTPRTSGTNEADEISGIHRDEELKRATELVEMKQRLAFAEKELDESKRAKRDSGIWWKQQRWLLLFGVIMAILVAALSIGGGLIMWWLTAKPTKAAIVNEIPQTIHDYSLGFRR